MRFVRLQLDRFGVHRKLLVEFDRRTNGIIGANGRGKSTVLAALEYAVTGMIPLAGAKDENICQLEDGASRVTAVIEHAGRTLEIVRGLKKAKTELRIDGGEPVLGDRPVNQALAEIFGPSIDLFSEYVFVKQGRISAFLDATEAERSKVLQQLFGTRKAEEAWAAIGKYTQTVEVPQRSVEIDALKRRIADRAGEVLDLKRELKQYADAAPRPAGEEDPDEALLARHRREQAASLRFASLTSQYDLKRAAWEKKDRNHLALKAELLEARKAAEGAQPRIEALVAELARWKSLQAEQARHAAMARRKTQLQQERQAHPAPTQPEAYIEDSEELRGDMQAARDRQRELNRLVKTFDGKTAECPTCGTPTKTLAAKLQEAQQELKEIAEYLAEIEPRYQESRQHDRLMASYLEWKTSFQERVQQYREEAALLEQASETPPLQGSEPELRAELGRLRALVKNEADAVEVERLAAEQASRLAGELEAMHAQLDEARAAIAADPVSDEAVAAADARIATRRERIRHRGELQGRLSSLEQQQVDEKAMLVRMETEMSKADKVRTFLADCQSAREVLHRGGLPRLVARGYLDTIEADVNRLLERFDADFRIATQDDLSYRADFTDGRAQPASRLSGGQKVLLAIAFRVAVNSLFAGEIGVLALDEPSEFLDERNLGALEVALGRLRELSDATGLQCLLVTHERRLSRLFDRVLELS